jgi:hypothetical protein
MLRISNYVRFADLFNLDNLSDDMDMTGTQTTADVVMNSLYHPNTYRTSSRVGRMTKEYDNPLLSLSLPYLRSSATGAGSYRRLLADPNSASSRHLISSSKP